MMPRAPQPKRHRLVLEAEPMIKRTAARIRSVLRTVALEDLCAIGRLEAQGVADTYDPVRGSFQSYAYPAVFGAMLDAASKEAKLTAFQRDLIKGLAGKLPELLPGETTSNGSLGACHSNLMQASDVAGAALQMKLAATPPLDPVSALMQAATKDALSVARKKLSQKHQRVLELHWDADMPLEEVGRLLGLKRTAIKALHRAALVALAGLMEEWR